jgi:WD40 repeat protein
MRFVSFLPDGKHFIIVGKLGYIALIDTNSAESIRSREKNIEHHFFPRFIAPGPDRKKILLGSDIHDEYMIWDIESGEEEWFKTPAGILSFAVSPDGHTLACGRQNGIDLYRFGASQKIKTFPLIQTNVTALAFSPDGKHLAFGSDNNANALYSVRFEIFDIDAGTPGHSMFTPVDYSPFAVCDPDGKHIYTRASRNILKIWDPLTGNELLRIAGDWRNIDCAGLSPDGERLAGALADSDTIKIWDTRTGHEINVISTGLPNAIESIHFIGCGENNIVVFTRDHTFHIFNAKTGKLILSYPKNVRCWHPNFIPSDDRYFAIVWRSEESDRENVSIFDTKGFLLTGNPGFQLPENKGNMAALYYTPGIILTALYKQNFDPNHPESEEQLVIVNMVSGETLYSDAASHINGAAITFSPSGEFFTVSYGRDLHIVSVSAAEGREIVHIPVNHQASITHVTYLPDMVISVSDDCINIADSKTGKLLRTIEESADLLPLPAIPDGRILVTASNSIIKTWNIKKKTQETEFPVPGCPEAAACIPEGGKLFSVTQSAASDQIIQRHDTITGKKEHVFPVSEEFFGVNRFSFRPGTDQALLYDLFSSRAAKIYNFRTGGDVLTLERKGRHTCAIYSHDGKFIVRCCGDPYARFSRRKRTIVMSDADTGAEIKKFPRLRDDIIALALSHDDKYLVTGSARHKIALWDLEERAVIRTYSGHRDAINAVSFTHDGKRIVSSSEDTSMRIWDRESAACLAVFHGIMELIPESVSNPVWRFIAALTVHGTVKLFDKDTLEEAAHIINFKDGSWVFAGATGTNCNEQ